MVDPAAFNAAGELPRADVVLLAIPYGARPPYYEALSRSGTAVYVEKPFAVTLAEHRARSAMFADWRIACGFQRRSMGTSAALREVIRSNLYGRLESARVEFGRPATRTGTYQSNLALAGGGMLLDVGSHALDLTLFVADAVRAEVASVDMIREEGFDIHTDARIAATRPNGDAFQIELICSSLRFTRSSNVFSFEHAEVTHELWRDGALIVRPRDSTLSFRMSGDSIEIPQTPNQVFHRHWTAFFEAIRAGVSNYTCAVDTQLTTAVLEKLYAGGC
jgi:predicted dehydrogenase